MEIVFFNDRVYDFLFSLEPKLHARVIKALGLLETYGNEIRYPHTKQVARGIFELRVVGDQHLRVFFVFHASKAVVLHAFIKKTKKIPKREIVYAQSAHSLLQER